VNIVVSPGSAQSRAWHGQARRSAEVLPEKEGEEGTIRLSIGWENKEKDIRRTVDRLEEAVRRIREFAAASPDGDVTVFTFPDKGNAAAALKALKDEDMVFSPVLKPDELMQALCSNISLACLSRDQARIGSLLGAHGIEIAGMHTAHPMERPMKKKERDFWEKVEQIKKRNA
jgi:hypothetical protein